MKEGVVFRPEVECETALPIESLACVDVHQGSCPYHKARLEAVDLEQVSLDERLHLTQTTLILHYHTPKGYMEIKFFPRRVINPNCN